MCRVTHWKRRAGELASSIAFQQSLLLPLPVAFLHRFALVVYLLATRQRQLDLGPAGAIEIDGQRDERQTLARHRAVELGYLAAFQQQLPRSARFVVQAIAMAVLGNMAVDQPDFIASHRRLAFCDRTLTLTERLHLGAGKLDPCLESLLDEIVEARAAVFGHDLLLVEWVRKRLGHKGSDQPRMLERGVDGALRCVRRLDQRQA